MDHSNSYGKITNNLVTASFYGTGPDVEYAGCYEIYNQEPVGDKFDQRVQVSMIDGKPMATINGIAYAELPNDWPQFITQIRQRGPIHGWGSVIWRDDEFRVRVNLDDA